MKKSKLFCTAAFTVGLMTTSPAAMANPAIDNPDGSWVSVSGTITSTTPDSFRLDYGEGLVTVEMDDWDWFQEGRQLIEGDEVVVRGRVDDDLYDMATIEASSVYVEGLKTYFYANDADEEDLVYNMFSLPINPTWLDISGTVQKVDGREFTINTGQRELTVDTSQMPYNPMDDEGYQKIKVGDLVKVSGNMDYDLFEKKELMADTVLTLKKDRTKTSG